MNDIAPARVAFEYGFFAFRADELSILIDFIVRPQSIPDGVR
jgi:hypothetical protein